MKALLSIWGLSGLLALAACGGRANDTTMLSEPPPLGPVEPPRSEALDVLAEPAAREAFCGWIGASVTSRMGTPFDCSRVVDRCREAASNAALDSPLDVASGLLGGSGDLQGVLGCPVSFDAVDSCLAQLIELSVARNPEGPGCGTAAAVEPLGVSDLPALPSCIAVAVQCPQLLQQLLSARG